VLSTASSEHGARLRPAARGLIALQPHDTTGGLCHLHLRTFATCATNPWVLFAPISHEDLDSAKFEGAAFAYVNFEFGKLHRADFSSDSDRNNASHAPLLTTASRCRRILFRDLRPPRGMRTPAA